MTQAKVGHCGHVEHGKARVQPESVWGEPPRIWYSAAMTLYAKAVLVWFFIAACETLHGVARARFLARRVGDFRSRQIGVLTGSMLIYAITALTFSWLHPEHRGEAFQIGGLWLGLMLLFEFIVGHFVFRFPWRWLLDEYNVKKGRLLLFGMALLFFAPFAVGRFKGVF